MNERLTTYDSKMTKTINNLDGELATVSYTHLTLPTKLEV